MKPKLLDIFFVRGNAAAGVFFPVVSIYEKVWVVLVKLFRETLIKNDAGEAQDPSRKMRLEKNCRNHGLTSTHDEF